VAKETRGGTRACARKLPVLAARLFLEWLDQVRRDPAAVETARLRPHLPPADEAGRPSLWRERRPVLIFQQAIAVAQPPVLADLALDELTTVAVLQEDP
jgi:hypothetical protein